mgnify:CR=1 FL=1
MPQIKLVVWDLDNTLWDGSVYYTDKNNIKLKPGTKEALKELTNLSFVIILPKKTGKGVDDHISLNSRKVSEIKQFLES